MTSSIPFKVVAAWATFLSKLNDDVGSHEGLAIKVCYGIFSILRALELDKSEARHDAAVDDTTITLEEFGNIVRSGIRRQSYDITVNHGMSEEKYSESILPR
jgi:hypothetical protein